MFLFLKQPPESPVREASGFFPHLLSSLYIRERIPGLLYYIITLNQVIGSSCLSSAFQSQPFHTHLTSIALLLLRTLDNITTPCSVKA
jgi:hypothetical protein